MNRFLYALPALLIAATFCAGCRVSPGTTPTRSGPTGRPGYCTAYPAPGTCNTGQCDIASAQGCPIECTGGADGQLPACAPSMACEFGKTAEYHNCLARCSAIPFECR